MTIKTTYDINSLCEDLVTLSKKEGLLFSKNIMFFVVYMKSKPIAFFGLKIMENSAIIKCDYVIKSERGNKLIQKMITFRLNWLRIYKPKIKKVTANTTQMATNSHLKSGAKIIKKYNNNITKVQYEIL